MTKLSKFLPTAAPPSPLDPSALSVPQHLRRRLASRWKLWEPWVRIALNGDYSSSRYEGYRNRHRDRFLLLMSGVVTMNSLTRNHLDDPRLTEPEFRAKLSQHLRIREAQRLGREKPKRREF